MPDELPMQVYDRGKGLAFHFDKDETLMAQQKIMRQPALSSILYLTGSCQSDRLGSSLKHPFRSGEATCAQQKRFIALI